MPNYPEAAMSSRVVTLLESWGYTVYAEIDDIDHIGIRWEDESIICVQMKCSVTKKLLDQAWMNTLRTPLVYVAVPRQPRKASIAKIKEHELGLIVNGIEIFSPTSTREIATAYRERTLRLLRQLAPGGIGGMPVVRGDGPAIRCVAAVKAYLETHPGASWKQMFREVPNHYASHRSMRSAIGWRVGWLPQTNVLPLFKE